MSPVGRGRADRGHEDGCDEADGRGHGDEEPHVHFGDEEAGDDVGDCGDGDHGEEAEGCLEGGEGLRALEAEKGGEGVSWMDGWMAGDGDWDED